MKYIFLVPCNVRFVIFDLCIIVCCLVLYIQRFLFCFVGDSRLREKKWIFNSKMFIRASDKIECSVVDLFNLFIIRVFFFFRFPVYAMLSLFSFLWGFIQCLWLWIFIILAFVVRGDDDVAVECVCSMIP